MSMLAWTVLGILAAILVIRTRSRKTVGFYRHVVIGAVVAVGAGLLYSLIAKIGLGVFDAGRTLLTFVVALIAVYLSVAVAQAAQNARLR